jgi:iron complex outermembrane receptor protein
MAVGNEWGERPRHIWLRSSVARFGLLVAIGGAGVCGPRPSQAADQAGASHTVEEVIVTAEKRDATVQKSPISITALRGSDLLQAGVTNLTAVAEQVPGVSFKTGGPGQTEFEMRGLNSAGGNSPTVGFYLDETPLTSFAYATAGKVVIDPDLYDLNRVEVLRGPQGTLYGSGSMGGTIRVLTNQPDPSGYHASAEVIATGTQGGGANGGGNIMVNLPLAEDKAALRIVATDKYTSGWIDRIVLDPFPLPTNGGLTRGDVLSAPVAQTTKGSNWDNLQAARASLLIKPDDRASIDLTVMGQSIISGGQSLIDVPPGNVEAHYQPFNTPEPVKDRFFLAALTLKYDFDHFQVVSATSYWRRSLTQIQDGSEVLQDVLALPGYTVADGGIGNDPWTEHDTANQISQEVRIASTDHSRFQWLAGVFYGDLSSKTVQYSVDDAAADVLGIATLYHEVVPQEFRQVAVFGEASYQIVPTVKATVGLRYFHFDNTFSTTEYGFFGPNGDLTPGGSQSEARQSGANPKFNLSWTPSGDLTLYATASKGFRPGGGNQIIPTSGTQEGEACGADLEALGKSANPATYGPDSVWSYEFGEKARLFGGRLSINGAAYYEKWSNIQREVTLNCGYIYTDNAGQAAVYGGELEVSARLGAGFTVNLTGGYTHATYTENSVETGVVKGDSLPDVPRYATSQSLIYSLPLDDRYTLVARATNSYIGSRFDINYYIDQLPAYDLLSGRLGVVSSQGWAAFLVLDNLTNKHALLNAINSQVLNIPTMTRDTTNQPRTIGVDLTYSF